MLQVRMRLMTTTFTLAGLLLAGCSEETRADPAPSPTWSCTPDASGEPCTPEKAAAQAEEAAAYDEAMHAYREFTKERNRLLIEGGTPTPTPTMERYAKGQYLSEIASVLATQHARGLRASTGLSIVSPTPVSVSQDRVVVRSCEDGSGIRLVDSSGSSVGSGSRVAVEVTIECADGEWRIVSGRDSKESPCPS